MAAASTDLFLLQQHALQVYPNPTLTLPPTLTLTLTLTLTPAPTLTLTLTLSRIVLYSPPIFPLFPFTIALWLFYFLCVITVQVRVGARAMAAASG